MTRQTTAQKAKAPAAAPAAAGGAFPGLLAWPQVDFTKFGPVERKDLSRIKKISGANLHRNWVVIPHVTNHDDADITELEAFRVQLNKENEKSGIKVTMLAFMIKAAVAALKKFPEFNSSLDGDQLVLKNYFHIGFAADTPNGLMVPVIKDADKKGIFQISTEMGELAKKARDGKLAPADMSGGCFSISSLGGIGGRYFTPIINAPEVAIMGVCKSAMEPKWDGKAFVPRLMLPLVAELGPPRDRRRRRGPLQRLLRVAAGGLPPHRALTWERTHGDHRSEGAGHRRLQGRGRHRTAGQARRHGEGRTKPDHGGKRQGLDGDPVVARRRGQGAQGRARRQGEPGHGVAVAGDGAAAAPAPAPAPAPAASAGRRCRRAPAPVAASHAGGADVECDLLVLGAGPGGYSAAFRAADLGLKMVLVERFPTLGGVCLNVGCIPSKALLHVAAVMDEVTHFADLGVTFGSAAGRPGQAAGAQEQGRRQAHRRPGGDGQDAQGHGGAGHRRVCRSAPPEVVMADGKTQTIRFKQAIIAAGSEAVKLPFLPTDDRIVTSTGALELRQKPERMLVIGGGIIGLEMGTVYSTLGARLDVVEMLDGLMQGADRDLVKVWQKMNAKRFDKLMLKTKTVGAEATADGIRVMFEGLDGTKSEGLYDLVLQAVGRTPNGKKIGADKAGVVVSDRGFIPVDVQMRTNVPHIFAIGDIVGQPMLAHKAVHEGACGGRGGGRRQQGDVRRACDPQRGLHRPRGGLGGRDRRRGQGQGPARCSKGLFPWTASGRAIANGRDEGFTKLLFDEETHRIVGGGIVGTHAGDMIGEIALAIEMGADAVDIGKTIHPLVHLAPRRRHDRRDRAGHRDGRRRGGHRQDHPPAPDAGRKHRHGGRGGTRQLHRPATGAQAEMKKGPARGPCSSVERGSALLDQAFLA